MKKQVLLFPLLGLLLAGCETLPSQGSQPGYHTSLESADPSQTCSGMTSAPTTESPASEEESCSCDDGDYSSNDDYDFSFPPGQKKPIIYFYPEEEMDLEVTFVEEERLLTTYPKYEGGWNIHLQKDGTFTVPGSNREYYALFFDELADIEVDFSEGFYVTKDNAISFLEEKMDFMGFTNREVDEFIMYWLPILENNGQSLVYFEQTEERNEECPLEFSLEPDTLIRTMIHIKKVDGPTAIPEQQLTHYEREGFAVVEWGGMEH